MNTEFNPEEYKKLLKSHNDLLSLYCKPDSCGNYMLNSADIDRNMYRTTYLLMNLNLMHTYNKLNNIETSVNAFRRELVDELRLSRKEKSDLFNKIVEEENNKKKVVRPRKKKEVVIDLAQNTVIETKK